MIRLRFLLVFLLLLPHIILSPFPNLRRFAFSLDKGVNIYVFRWHGFSIFLRPKLGLSDDQPRTAGNDDRVFLPGSLSPDYSRRSGKLPCLGTTIGLKTGIPPQAGNSS
jgi:hypothetical protein